MENVQPVSCVCVLKTHWGTDYAIRQRLLQASRDETSKATPKTYTMAVVISIINLINYPYLRGQQFWAISNNHSSHSTVADCQPGYLSPNSCLEIRRWHDTTSTGSKAETLRAGQKPCCMLNTSWQPGVRSSAWDADQLGTCSCKVQKGTLQIPWQFLAQRLPKASSKSGLQCWCASTLVFTMIISTLHSYIAAITKKMWKNGE